ncbi:hypothetical protein CEXT_329171 [Caerostris extrusa]|uniref:Uncharacterized protein n=1 Tax=Caerostris extrusa TaxID=172846 RepID=A0AAV4U7P8_CAEEX|nr:hypothetical protein CEXT_329171 [Caerostris extrusa]
MRTHAVLRSHVGLKGRLKMQQRQFFNARKTLKLTEKLLVRQSIFFTSVSKNLAWKINDPPSHLFIIPFTPRRGERERVVQIAKRLRRPFGDGIRMENPSAMHADSTSNYTIGDRRLSLWRNVAPVLHFVVGAPPKPLPKKQWGFAEVEIGKGVIFSEKVDGSVSLDGDILTVKVHFHSRESSFSQWPLLTTIIGGYEGFLCGWTLTLSEFSVE